MTKLQNAYETISDPEKRREYDLRWSGIRDSLRTQQESEKRQAEAAQAEQKRAAEARAKKQEEEKARQECLQSLEQSRSVYHRDIFEISWRIRKLAADLKILKDQDDEDVRKEKERNGWWTYVTSPIYGQVKETDEQKQERETKYYDRLASQRIKGSELAEKEARLKTLQNALRSVNDRIAAEKKTVEDEQMRIEREARARRLKAEQEAREREMRERWERIQRKQAELEREQAERAAAAREAREAREAQAAREARERARVAAEILREVEEQAQAMRTAREAARKAREKEESEWSGLKTPTERTTETTCLHEGWWPKKEGRQVCAMCRDVQKRFALRCPGCGLIACAACQKDLRSARSRSGGVGVGGGGRGRGRGRGRGGVRGRWCGLAAAAAAAGNEYYYDDNPAFDYD